MLNMQKPMTNESVKTSWMWMKGQRDRPASLISRDVEMSNLLNRTIELFIFISFNFS